MEGGLVAAAVGMGLAQPGPVGGLDLGSRGLWAHPENAVVVRFVHHSAPGRSCGDGAGTVAVPVEGSQAPPRLGLRYRSTVMESIYRRVGADGAARSEKFTLR
ncbi:hypothetical protein GCM10029992_44950 [Glycomyces albus]